MTATFGKLREQTLELGEGLNILQAPNETGKSTWCAFLLSMLYGVNSRERERAGFIPDKTRYAPWSGASMSGRMDCLSNGQALTLTRTTRRQTAPMGEFQAVYTGTGDQVLELTGQTCGETLLGVSREVFERSAFIRQAGLPISQDAGLERRIASLITSGEEDTSYSEAADALKKQANRRRHNKTGQLPALETELQETQRQLEEARDLAQRLSLAQAQAETQAGKSHALAQELADLDRWEAARQHQALAKAQADAEQTEAKAAALRRRLAEDRIPENDAIARLRGAIVNLESTRKAVEKARAERDDGLKSLLRAEAAVNESPFAGQTPEQARREAAEPPPPAHWNRTPAILTVIAGTIAAFILFYIVAKALNGSPWQKPASLAVLLAGVGTAYFCARHLRRRAIQAAQAAALTKRFGTADPTAITALAETYARLCQARDDAQAEADRRSAAADTLYNTLTANEQGLLLEVRRFAPSAFDLSAADQLLRECAVRRKEAQAAETAAAQARMRADLLAQQAPAAPGQSENILPPARPRETVEAELAQAQAELAAARSAADQLAGQCLAAGDPAVLASAAALTRRQIQTLEAEYAALQLARETLDQANTTLQNRFSPALGKRAAEIFRQLTADRYQGVVLDRSLHLSAEPAGTGLYRDAALLSAGTADQLYLAARLAICDLVLPPESAAPIILDDALSNFDDDRCAAALNWLRQEAAHRQILLFTCHSREADFFAGDPAVTIQRLTETA